MGLCVTDKKREFKNEKSSPLLPPPPKKSLSCSVRCTFQGRKVNLEGKGCLQKQFKPMRARSYMYKIKTFVKSSVRVLF